MTESLNLGHLFAAVGGAVGAFLAKLVMHPMDKRSHKWSHGNIVALRTEAAWVRTMVRRIAVRFGIELPEPPGELGQDSPPPYEMSLEEITKPGGGGKK